MQVVACTTSLVIEDGLDFVDFYLCDFDIFDQLILVLYEDVIIFVGCHEQLIMPCINILAREVDIKDVGVWQVIHS
jgi:hypothetical protein